MLTLIQDGAFEWPSTSNRNLLYPHAESESVKSEPKVPSCTFGGKQAQTANLLGRMMQHYTLGDAENRKALGAPTCWRGDVET